MNPDFSISSAALGTALYVGASVGLVLLAQRFVRRMSRVAVIVMLLLPLCFTGRALLTGRVYSPIDLPLHDQPLESFQHDFGFDRVHNGILSDVFTLNIPWKYAARLAITHGEWPLWNPYVAAGDILAASAQPTPYEPIFLISLLLPMPASLTFLASMTFFLGLLLMFLFLRELGCSEWAALAGATGWTFCMFLVFYLDWVIGPTSVWFPLVLLGVRRIVRTPGLNPMGILTVAFSMMLLNGHPESALHIVAVGLLWALAELWNIQFQGFKKSVPLAFGAGALALLLTAIYMLPILEAIPQTSENRHRKVIFVHAVRSAPLEIVEQKLLLQFVPFLHGEPQREWKWKPGDVPYLAENAYAGGAVMALALIGLCCSRWRGRWFVLTLIFLGTTIGIELAPFADLVAKLPLFDIALNERLILVAALGATIFAALGVDVIINGRKPRRTVAAALVVVAALSALCWWFYPNMIARGLSPGYVREKCLLLLLPALFVALSVALRRRPALLGFALVALIAGERALESADTNPTLSARMFYPKIPILNRLPRGEEPYRITGFGWVFLPNMATMYQLEDVRSYSAMTFMANYDLQELWSVQQPVFFNRVDDPSKPFLSLLNVKYALAEKSMPLPDGWSLVMQDRGSQLFENQHVLPRAFIPKSVFLSGEPFVSYGQDFRTARDYGERSWIVDPGAAPHEEQNGSGSLNIRKRGMGTLLIGARLDSDAWVVVSEMAWKGWRAYIDGKPTKLRSANGMLLAMLLPSGQHEVRLVYLPRSFVVGRAISAGTLVVIAISAGIALIRRRRKAPES